MTKATPTADSLRDLRKRVKEQKGSVAEMARELDMPRTALSRVLGPKTIDKIAEVEQILTD
jgi:transcriptional regulator of acetoin/glycerol metabolism